MFARESQAAANRAQADLMTAAVTWAEQHPPESIDEAATWITPGGDTGLTLAGEGAPLVAEFCIAEFALAIGRSTDGGRALVAAAVELKYRLPRHWARVQAGDLEAWRARRIAEATMLLSQEAAAFVDAQVAPFAHRIGIAALERLIAEAIARFMPEKAAEDAEKSADGRHFTIDHQQVSFGGTSQLTGELDLADALDLDTAIAKGAQRAAGPGVDRLPRRTPLHRRRPARPQPARPRPRPAETTRRGGRAHHRRPPTQASSGGAARAPLRHRDHRDQRVGGAGAGGEPAPDPHRRPDPHLVRQPRRRSHREAGDRPRTSTSTSRATRSPTASGNKSRCATTPACSPGAPDQPESWMPTTSSPTPKAAPPAATTSRHCADDIID